jgi:hypothetical protein
MTEDEKQVVLHNLELVREIVLPQVEANVAEFQKVQNLLMDAAKKDSSFVQLAMTMLDKIENAKIPLNKLDNKLAYIRQTNAADLTHEGIKAVN